MYENSLTAAEGKEMRKDFKATSIFLYIYTSGTTGLPKAAKISSVRFCFAGVGFAASFKLKRSDRIYCPLPIYHSAGGMLGLSVSLFVGGTFLIRSKFSASNFFKDCHNFDCTFNAQINLVNSKGLIRVRVQVLSCNTSESFCATSTHRLLLNTTRIITSAWPWATGCASRCGLSSRSGSRSSILLSSMAQQKGMRRW